MSEFTLMVYIAIVRSINLGLDTVVTIVDLCSASMWQQVQLLGIMLCIRSIQMR